jgi:sigma-B regulation protein RsbU (phosphoserine phosphatase)
MLRVAEVMNQNPLTIPPQMKASEAAALMNRFDIGCLLVCDQSGLIGILSEKDLVRFLGSRDSCREQEVSSLMSANPVSVTPEEALEQVLRLFEQHRVRHLPVINGEQLVGIVSVRDVIRNRTEHLEALVYQQTAELEAKNAALGERERLMRAHLKMAGNVQRQMLPPAGLQAPPMSLVVNYRPAEWVSGDYYDFTEVGEELGILIADATGHGVSAALISVAAKAIFQDCIQHLSHPSLVLETFNEHLLTLIEGERFVTMFYGVVNRRTLTLRYASAGHPSPLLYRRAEGRTERLDVHGLMLGALPKPIFEEKVLKLCPGDILLLYTDGLSECRNKTGELYGPQRAQLFLLQNDNLSLAELVDALYQDVLDFCYPSTHSDDLTLMALGVNA